METTLRIQELMHNFSRKPKDVPVVSGEDTESEKEKFPASSKVHRREKSNNKMSSSLVTFQCSNSADRPLFPACQVENCRADLGEAKLYYRRHRICEHHSKAPFVMISGLPQRFCQQCSRLHELAQFDDRKRSCRRQLAGHNQRRRTRNNESCENSPRHKHARTQLEEVRQPTYK